MESGEVAVGSRVSLRASTQSLASRPALGLRGQCCMAERTRKSQRITETVEVMRNARCEMRDAKEEQQAKRLLIGRCRATMLFGPVLAVLRGLWHLQAWCFCQIPSDNSTWARRPATSISADLNHFVFDYAFKCLPAKHHALTSDHVAPSLYSQPPINLCHLSCLNSCLFAVTRSPQPLAMTTRSARGKPP